MLLPTNKEPTALVSVPYVVRQSVFRYRSKACPPSSFHCCLFILTVFFADRLVATVVTADVAAHAFCVGFSVIGYSAELLNFEPDSLASLGLFLWCTASNNYFII